MQKAEIMSESFELENVIDDDSGFTFTAKSLSKDFECEDGLKRLAKDSINKHYIWRHAHPIDNKNQHIYGVILESNVKDGHIVSKYKMFEHTKDHVDMINVIKERIRIKEPLGVSMRYRKYTDIVNGTRKAVHYDVFEHSGTPDPACKTCKTIDFKGENNMPEEENIEEPKPGPEEEELEDKEDALVKIKELEDSLNSKTETLESFKSQIGILEKQLEAKDEIKKTLDERVEQLEHKLEYSLEKKPIIDLILEHRKVDERMLEWFKSQDTAYLKDVILEDAKTNSVKSIQVKSQEESLEEIEGKIDVELENDKKGGFEMPDGTMVKKVPLEHMAKDLGIKIKKE